MSAKPDLWMPLYFGPYLTDTMHLKTEQHGAYFLLLMACWKRGGELPDDDEQLAAITRLTIGNWRKARVVIAPFWQIKGGKWTQKRLTIELQAARERSATAKENGSKGGRPKKADENPTENPDETQKEPGAKPNCNPDESSVPLPRPLQTSRPGPAPEDQTHLSGKPDDAPPASKKLNGAAFYPDAENVLSYLNKSAGKGFEFRNRNGELTTNADRIIARLKQGYTCEELREVVHAKCEQWAHDEKMAEFLRPATLFGKEKFEQYLGELKGATNG